MRLKLKNQEFLTRALKSTQSADRNRSSCCIARNTTFWGREVKNSEVSNCEPRFLIYGREEVLNPVSGGNRKVLNSVSKV